MAIDELDRAIVELSARINAATYELLVLIRQFDERAGWLKWGLTNCVDWLHWRCDLSLSAAREKVRVAHALKTLPAISTAFANGELSYSKVRALTRVVGSDNEEDLLTFARKTTAARVEERCRELRCGTDASVDEANRAHAGRSLTLRRDPQRGTMIITVELPIETGELIDKALDRARDASSSPEFAEESWAARQADALVTMARAYLNGQREASVGTSENYQVTVHVDRSALIESRGRSGLPIESVKRLACDGDTVVIVEDEDGETSLENLMLLCSRHHRLVHEGGFRIDKDYRDRWVFKRPDGIAVPSCGYRPEDTHDDDVDTISTLINNPSAEGLLTTVKNSQPERLPATLADRSPAQI